MRHIHWSATAKHQKLISREYTTERNQNVVILLDCGRSMRPRPVASRTSTAA